MSELMLLRDKLSEVIAKRRREAGHRQAQAEEVAKKLASAGKWDLLCPNDDGRACTGETFVRLPDGAELAVRCPLAEAGELCPPKRRALLIALGFGPRYADPSRERMLPVIGRAVDEFLGNAPDNIADGRGLWLAGPVGVGKTAALAYLAARQWSPKCTVVYRTAPELFDQLAHEGITDALRDVPVLMVDDLGTEYDANWPLSRFGELMDWRWRFQKSVFVTSNLMPAQLAQDRRWERVISRWRATLAAYWQDGQDMRRAENE